MNSIRFLGALAASAVFATAAFAQPAADLSGTWTASFDSQVGKQTYTYTIKVAGGAITGTPSRTLARATSRAP